MADEHIRTPDDQIRRGAAGPAHANTRNTQPGQSPQQRPPSNPRERRAIPQRSALHMRTRWAVFIVLVLLVEFTFAFAAGLVIRLFGFPHGGGIGAVIGIILGGYFLWRMEDDCWLSRVFGLQTDPYTSAVKAYLWEKVLVGHRLEAGSEQREAPVPTAHTVSREIAETVVFVVVLVLLLKAFVAQAFVIPTGSMAVTLYGYQMHVKCPKCGIEFPVNASNAVDPSDGGPQVPVEACICPNCRYQIDFREEMRRNPKFERPSPSTGDRVLVADFLYDLPGGGPKRLDVVVFKYPGDSNPRAFTPFPISGPQKGHSAMNYIKRLIGEPGETIGIWHGKLYRLPADQLPPEKKAEYQRRSWDNIWDVRIAQAPTEQQEQLRERKARGEEPPNWERDLWRWENMFRNDLDMIDQLRKGVGFQIIRKPPDKILETRRLVFDYDHPAEDLRDRLRDRWEAEEKLGWTPTEPRAFQASPTPNTTWLRYHHILRPSGNREFRGNKEELITDFMGYNTYEPHRGGSAPGPNWVGDLLIECEVVVEQPDGSFTLELSKGTDRFRATWELGSGKCTLSRLKEPHTGSTPPDDSRYTELDSKPTKLQGKHLVRFANVDDRLLVWVDSELPFGDGFNYPPFDAKGPDANDLQPASIGAQGATLKVQKLSLWRDTYYTRDPSEGADATPDEGDWSDPSKWPPLGKIEPTTLYVQPGHYLCLGDNSPESSDGRSWGLVPKRLLLGRALVVYYPFYFPWWPLSNPENRMRVIK